MRVALCVVLVALLGTGCGSGAAPTPAPTEEGLHAEFDAFVAAHNQCRIQADCVLAYPDCPLGCYVAVNAQSKASVEQKAKELLAEYEKTNPKCSFDCLGATAACDAGRCQAFPN